MATIRPRTWPTHSGKTKSGYEVTWYALVAGQSKRKRKLFSGSGARKRAQAFCNRQSALEAQGIRTGTDQTVLDAGNAWIKSREKLKRERSTTDSYQQHLDDHIAPTLIQREGHKKAATFGSLRLVNLTTPDCALLRDALLDKISIKLTKKVLGTLRMMLNGAMVDGAVGQNVADKVRIETMDREDDGVEIPTPEECAQILAACRTQAPAPPTFDEVWTVFGVSSGMRPSEQRAAAIEDLVLEGPNPGMPVRFKADKWQEIGLVKTKRSRRWIPFGPAMVKLLKRWLLVVPRGAGFDDPERPGRTLHPLFPTLDGTIQGLPNIYNRAWKPLMNQAGLAAAPTKKEIERAKAERRAPLGKPRYSVNCRRHIAASVRIDEGWDPQRVADFLGHSSAVVTLKIYSHLFRKRERQRDDTAAIEAKLLG